MISLINAVYTSNFTRRIVRLTESGTYQKWIDAYTKGSQVSVAASQWRCATFQDYKGCFAIYLISLNVAMFMFFAELIRKWVS